MDGYNMNTSKSNMEFFDLASIDKYCILSNKLILADNIYYFGSYILDINGNRLRDIDLWAGDYKYDDNERKREIANREDYKNIYSIFTSKDKNPSSSITECIQKQYLKIQDQVLHLFCVSEKRCYEIISRKDEILMRKGINHELFDDYQSLLTDLGRKNESTIESTFDYHFNLIKKAQSPHIYFFPTILRLSGTIKVINVSTIISPSLLEDDNITNIQYGLEISTSCLMSDAANYFYKLAQDKAVKSAKAAIMSRNMSHNLGSHVMSYLKHNLGSVTTMMRDNVLQEIISCKLNNVLNLNEDIFADLNSAFKKNRIALPFLLGVGHFISYLQERQDFIATVATDFIPYNSTVNFKDYIYDELNPDKRFERHKELLSIYKIDNILLGYIARSEGLGRFTSPTKGEESKLCDIVLKFGSFDGNKDSSKVDLDRLRNFNVSLPGGIVGRQAVFSILENIIRNAAKHGNWKKSGKLELTIDYYTKDTINLAADDDQCEGCKSLQDVLNSFYKDAYDSDDLYFVTITDNTETDLSTLIKLRKILCEDYIESTSKGLMEMRISASWLRSIEEEDKCYNPYLAFKDDDKKIESDSFPKIDSNFFAPILYVRLQKPNEYHPSNLQFIICLPKPREIAFISEGKTNGGEANNKDSNWTKFAGIVQNHKWKYYIENETAHDFSNQANKSFDFILCETEDLYKKIRPISNAKTFYLSDAQLGQILNEINDSHSTLVIQEKQLILNKIYEYFYRTEEDEFIVIDDKIVFSKAEELFNNGKCCKILIQAENKKDRNVYEIVETLIYKNKNSNPEKVDNELYKGFPEGTYYRIGKIVVGNVAHIYSNYSYRTHHETKDQFDKFMSKPYAHRVKFVEGISGNNATDRLVRHNSLLPELSPLWFYTHLHSMKQKIAIIDERIFYRIYGIDEVNFLRGKAYSPQTGLSSDEYAVNNDLLNAKKYYIDNFPVIDKDRINMAEDMSVLQTVVSSDYSNCIRCDDVYTKGYSAYTYSQKNIMIFTIIPSDVAYGFEIVGIQFEDGAIQYDTHTFECKCVPIGTIIWKEGKEKPEIILYNYNIKYDFISIHQGLLDKIFESFEKKKNDKDIDIKEEIISQLYDKFSSYRSDEIIHEENNSAFYPGIIIHSGRSKPSNEVMPLRVPFIQYATLEHAIFDCKYTLVELLDNARYE